VIAYQQARAQLDAEMNADLYGAGLWYGKYEQRIKVLDAQEATLIQEANGLKSVCSDIAKRDKEFDVVDKQFKARSKEITDMRQRLESDINQFNKPLKAANADRAWLESVGNWRRQSRE
jgi:predicted  nucleic acid-binding Zn-ribbon protein